MTTTTHTTDDYKEAIRRELAKRETTYPKIIAKKRKQGMPEDEIKGLIIEQAKYIYKLELIANVFDTDLDFMDAFTAVDYLQELQREMKMRKKYYPRMVYFNRITQEIADKELAVWQSLTDFFENKYLKCDQ